MSLWSWFTGSSSDRQRAASERLREAEEEEDKALRRMVDAGVKLVIHADDHSESMDELLDTLERRKSAGEKVLSDAEGVLRLIQRERH